MASNPSFIATVKTPVLSIVNGDGTAFKTLYTAGVNGGRVDAVAAINTDAGSAYALQLAIQVSGVDYEIGEVAVQAGAGTNGAQKSASLLNSTDLPFLAVTESGALFLAAGASLRVRSKTAVSGSNALRFAGVAGDY